MNPKVVKAEELIKTGMSVEDAAKQTKITPSTIYYYRAKDNKKPRKIGKKRTIIALPVNPARTDKIMVFYGSPESVAQAAKELL